MNTTFNRLGNHTSLTRIMTGTCHFIVTSQWYCACALTILAFLVAGCSKNPAEKVVVYAAQDQNYAEPILADFTRETGIETRCVYDSEAVKTVGIANRLLAERKRPKCDLFWGNEELRTRQLAAANVFRETNGVISFGRRERCIVINTNKMDANRIAAMNHSMTLAGLTNRAWEGKAAIAYPMFGTTCTHFLLLRHAWGEQQWLKWCQALRANRPFLADGNSQVVKLVGRGDAWIGLTDSDDITAGLRQGLPIASIRLETNGLQIPNTLGLVRNSPNPAAADRLMAYLMNPAVARRLADAGAIESGAGTPSTLTDWNSVLKDLDPAVKQLKEIFLR